MTPGQNVEELFESNFKETLQLESEFKVPGKAQAVGLATQDHQDQPNYSQEE